MTKKFSTLDLNSQFAKDCLTKEQSKSVMKNVTQPTRPRSFAKVCGQVICGSALKH